MDKSMIKYFFTLSFLVAVMSCGPVPIPLPRGEGENHLVVKETQGNSGIKEKSVIQDNKPAINLSHINTTHEATTSDLSATPGQKKISEENMTADVDTALATPSNKKSVVIPATVDAPHVAPPKNSPIASSNTDRITTSSNYQSAKKYIKKKNYQLAISIVEQATSRERNDKVFRELMISAYVGHTKYLISKKKYTVAKETITKASHIAPKRRIVMTLSKAVDRKILSNKHYQQGLDALKLSDNKKALQEFTHVLAIDNNNKKARQQVAQLTQRLTTSLHEKAMELYDGQMLDEAIAVWEDLLRIDPGHQSAKDYIKKSIAIKKRMSTTN